MLVRSPAPKALLNSLICGELSGPVSILEAGGGSKSHLEMRRLNVSRITTIDISQEQLDRNTYADTKILGDLEEYHFEDRYDLIIIYDVLEHLARADRALERLTAACADNGLLVVGSPCEKSFSGMITRLSPHWFHVFFYRRFRRYRDAGRPGHPPFETIFHPLTEPGRLAAWMEKAGFECLLLATFESAIYSRIGRVSPLLAGLVLVFPTLINIVTPKRYNARHGDYHAVFRRVATPA